MTKKVNDRVSSVNRNTNETQIRAVVNLDGTGKNSIITGLPFFDHMIEQLSKHSLIDIDLKCNGDLHIDSHHTMEDVGWALGKAINEALGNKKGIKRLLLKIDNKTPINIGPATTPICHPASNRAKPAALVSGEVKSAILPPAAGLTALPNKPLINLVIISKGRIRAKGIKFKVAAEIIAAKRIIEIENPKIPKRKIHFLPNLSLKLPQKGLKNIHASAEIENIIPTSNSLNPSDLTSAGIKINIVD